MSIRTLFSAGAIAVALAAASASAQTTITQWNFNSNPPDASTATGTLSPSFGAGSAACYNVAPSAPLAECIFASGGGSTDPGVDNTGWQTRGYQSQGVGPGTVGVELAVSTANFNDIIVTWDQRHSNTSSRYSNLFYSLDGVNFVEFPGAPFEGNAGDTWFNTRTVSLSGISGANNNPNFRFRISPVFDPALGNAYSASNSSSTYASTGTYRFDMVTVSGTAAAPIPPMGSGGATPGAVCAGGGLVRFSVSVVPGVNPVSTGITVTADLTDVGGGSAVSLIDQGNDLYQLDYIVPGSVTVGIKTIPIIVADAESRSSMIEVGFAVADCSTNSDSRVVISQMYGGGGNLGPPAGVFNADYVELFNRSNQTVDLTGWSVQYASAGAAGGFNSAIDRVELSGVIRPGQYMLVRFSDFGTTGSPLPNADFVGTGGMGNNAGRVALVRSTVLIGANCDDASVEDLATYGGAICFEGAAPGDGTANDTASLRDTNGAQDTDQNFNDFTVGSPTPRNRASNGFLAGYPSLDASAICAGESVNFSVAVFPGASPPSTGIQVLANLSQLGGSASQALSDSGGNVYTLNYAIPGSVTQGVKIIPITVSDGQGRSDASALALSVATCNSSAARIVVSAFFGGGGNAGAPFDSDYIEIFNRSAATVDLTGWSVQYADADNAPGFIATRVVPLSGVIAPGHYRLIRTSAPGANGIPLPTPDFTPAAVFGMDNASGRIAVVRTATALGTNCAGPDIEDLVGYGEAALCLEGIGPTADITNVTGGYRLDDGCQDFNHNVIDFDVIPPINLPRNSASPAHLCPAPAGGACCCGSSCTNVANAGLCVSPGGGIPVAFVSGGNCSPFSVTTPCCRANFNRSGGGAPISSQDIFDFLASFFSTNASIKACADFNGNPPSAAGVSSQDIFDFLGAFFRPGGCNP